jgi:hypothetical protein
LSRSLVGVVLLASDSESSEMSATVKTLKALQSIRYNDLEQQHQIWTQQNQQEESYWLKQEERFNLLLKRSEKGMTNYYWRKANSHHDPC